MRAFLIISSIILWFITGCGRSDKAVLYSRLNNIDINSVKVQTNLLYFADTKNTKFYTNGIYPQSSTEWVDVEVRDREGGVHTYSVMKSPIYQNGYEFTNITYDEMANFCYNKYQASILSIRVLEEARKNRVLYPASKYEILVPIDMDEDAIFIKDGDKLVINDTDIVKFNWQNEKYYSVPFTFRSKYATFRCMKEK